MILDHNPREFKSELRVKIYSFDFLFCVSLNDDFEVYLKMA